MLRYLGSVLGPDMGLASIRSAVNTAKQTEIDRIIALAVRTLLIASAAALLHRLAYWLKERLTRDLFPSAYLAASDTSSLWVMAWISQDPAAQAQIKNFQLSTSESREVRRGSKGLLAQRAGRKVTVGEHNASWTSEEVIGQMLPTYGQGIRIKDGNNYLWITRRTSHFANTAGHIGSVDHLRIRTLLWQRNALKDFLSGAHKRYFSKLDQELLIFHPEIVAHTWQRPICRPARPWSSVILPDSVKEDLLADVERFLSDAEVDWYAERGIPHRRGYLFYGEPGAGKTTLATAIASKLKLDVYVINPAARGMDDSRLNKLFRECPARSIIIIEDIDCVFPPKTATKIASSTITNPSIGGPAPTPLAPSPGPRVGSNPLQSAPVVTLSGLLNAIDGVSSQEGCILIASTNYIDHLDCALRRPGRFDIQIPFYNATRQQARCLFIHFYPVPAITNLSEKSSSTFPADIDALASEFADAILPAETKSTDTEKGGADAKEARGFSMAALQGYLMGYKNDPVAAVQGAGAWAAGQFEAKMPRKTALAPTPLGMDVKADAANPEAPAVPPEKTSDLGSANTKAEIITPPNSAGMDDVGV